MIFCLKCSFEFKRKCLLRIWRCTWKWWATIIITEEIVGVAWDRKRKIYVTNDLSVFGKPFILGSLIRLGGLMIAKRTYVALSRYTGKTGIDLDVFMGAYLLDTNEKKHRYRRNSRSLRIQRYPIRWAVYIKGAKKGLPEEEELFPHLARKVAAINALTPKLNQTGR